MGTPKRLTATSSMLIRKPVSEVFEALANPEITSKFWFTKGSGRLEAGKTIRWKWEQFGVHADINVTEIKPDRLIKYQWPADEEGSAFRTVNISFEPTKSGQAVFVRVIEEGFDAEDDHLIEVITGQTEGWALVLSSLKAWVEHRIDLNLINDHKPTRKA